MIFFAIIKRERTVMAAIEVFVEIEEVFTSTALRIDFRSMALRQWVWSIRHVVLQVTEQPFYSFKYKPDCSADCGDIITRQCVINYEGKLQISWPSLQSTLNTGQATECKPFFFVVHGSMDIGGSIRARWKLLSQAYNWRELGKSGRWV